MAVGSISIARHQRYRRCDRARARCRIIGPILAERRTTASSAHHAQRGRRIRGAFELKDLAGLHLLARPISEADVVSPPHHVVGLANNMPDPGLSPGFRARTGGAGLSSITIR